MIKSPLSAIEKFLKLESSAGILLFCSACIAICIANTEFSHIYHTLLTLPVSVQVGDFAIAKPLLLWVNDGLMAVFFFLVGLELKRELIEGELSDPKNIVLPAAGAIGGMLIPALIYYGLNVGHGEALKGWAIPMATDIAFALGVLALLGSRVPIAIKIFLTTLAIFDDVGAIVIIALFYTSKISLLSLFIVVVCLFLLALLNKFNVMSKSPYILVGLVMWVATLKSGVHATLAGVMLALFIPLRTQSRDSASPLRELEHDLHTIVAFFILPVFAFFNAGVPLMGLSVEHLTHSVSLGVAAGLLVGKPVGVFVVCYLAVKLKLCTLPSQVNWSALLGVSFLCGIGFTMSLFIGSLAFAELPLPRAFDERIGILLGSVLSGVLGYFVLNRALLKKGE